MSTFTHPITLYSASGDQSEVVEALVDTGSAFTAVPSPVLERLGIKPHRTVRLRLANGQIDQRDLGRVVAELDGVEEIILCMFADAAGPAIIGASALEALLLAVDPVNKRLVPTDALWM